MRLQQYESGLVIVCKSGTDHNARDIITQGESKSRRRPMLSPDLDILAVERQVVRDLVLVTFDVSRGWPVHRLDTSYEASLVVASSKFS